MSALDDHAEAVRQAEWLNALGDLAATGPYACFAEKIVLPFPAARFGKEARPAGCVPSAPGRSDPGARR